MDADKKVVDLFFALNAFIEKNKNSDKNKDLYKMWNILFKKSVPSLTSGSPSFRNIKPKVMLTVSASSDVAFKETVQSFINMCEDVRTIDYWFCIDSVKRPFKWFQYEKSKGGLLAIWKKVQEMKPTYWIHLENGIFHTKMKYIERGIEGLKDAGQIGFNRHHGKTISDYDIKNYLACTDEYIESAEMKHEYKFPFSIMKVADINMEAPNHTVKYFNRITCEIRSN
jgi:hypothetical protein